MLILIWYLDNLSIILLKQMSFLWNYLDRGFNLKVSYKSKFYKDHVIKK